MVRRAVDAATAAAAAAEEARGQPLDSRPGSRACEGRNDTFTVLAFGFDAVAEPTIRPFGFVTTATMWPFAVEKMKTYRSGRGSPSMLTSRTKKFGVLGPRSDFGQRPKVVIVCTSRPPAPWSWVTCLMSRRPGVSFPSGIVTKLACAAPTQARPTATAITATIVCRGRIDPSPLVPRATSFDSTPPRAGVQGLRLPSGSALRLRVHPRARTGVFRKVRRELGVTAFGVNAMVLPTADRVVRALPRPPGRALLRPPGSRRVRGRGRELRARPGRRLPRRVDDAPPRLERRRRGPDPPRRRRQGRVRRAATATWSIPRTRSGAAPSATATKPSSAAFPSDDPLPRPSRSERLERREPFPGPRRPAAHRPGPDAGGGARARAGLDRRSRRSTRARSGGRSTRRRSSARGRPRGRAPSEGLREVDVGSWAGLSRERGGRSASRRSSAAGSTAATAGRTARPTTEMSTRVLAAAPAASRKPTRARRSSSSPTAARSGRSRPPPRA